jgi:hypothetical protein
MSYPGVLGGLVVSAIPTMVIALVWLPWLLAERSIEV